MATLPELVEWTAGIYQLEEEDVVQGGPDGIDNVQARQLAARTQYLKAILDNAPNLYQPSDATLTALAALVTQADRLIYSTGANAFALTALTAYARTLLASAGAAAARAALGAAPLASPAFTDVPTAPTAAPGTNNLQLANTAFVQAAVAGLVAASPSALDTLNELAAALGDDANFSTTITNALALKAPLAGPIFTGEPRAPTPPQFDASTRIPTMEAVQRALGNLASNVTVSVTGTLTAASAGVLHSLAPAAPITVTLPLRSTLNMGGETFPFVNISSVACTIATQGGDLIDTGASSETSLVLRPGEALMMSHATTGYAVIASHTPYVSVLAANGYHKLPGGLIVQWQAFNAAINSTTTVTLPVAFPNAFYGTVVTIRDNVANLATDPISAALPLTLSTFSLRSYYSGSNINNFCVSIGS